jgi:LysM repeat protein
MVLPTPMSDQSLILYASSTPTNSITSKSDPRTTQTLTPSPSITPITYTVVEDDTMLDIAFKYGIPLDSLLVSNPTVDPLFLTVGTVLVIPQADNLPAVYSTPTPFPIDVEVPLCYPVKDGGVWCFAMVTNNYLQPMEGVSGVIKLVAQDGSEITNRVANTPLKTLLPGDTMPMTVYFLPTINQEFLPHLTEVSALLVDMKEPGYIQVTNISKEVIISHKGTSASIIGSMSIPAASIDIKSISVLAIAYSEDGDVVGVRRKDEMGAFKPGEKIFYEVNVYTLDSPIRRVDVLVEAYP